MPLGNGSPRSLPSTPLGVLADPRQYDTQATLGGNGAAPTSSAYNPITKPHSDVYGQVVGSTPGLVHWWRFDRTYSTWGSSTTHSPYFANSAGAATLESVTANTPTLETGLLPGSPGKSVRTHTSWLLGFDYVVSCGCHEVGSFEVWFKPVALDATNSTIMGNFDGTNGWKIHVTNTKQLGLLTSGSGGVQSITSSANLISNGGLYHVVGVVGGTQSTNPDYVSRLYCNGVEVANGSFSNNSNLNPFGTINSDFGVGNCDNGAFNNWDSYIDEIAIYSRMLQPAEVLQHYQAAFVRA